MTIEEWSPGTTPRWPDLRRALHTVLLGTNRGRHHWKYLIGLGLSLFGVTFVAYELGIFYYSGGVVFIPVHATIVGVIVSIWSGFSRNGFVVGWILTYLSFLGMLAEEATNVSSRLLIDRIAAIIAPEGLIYFWILAFAVAVVGVTIGAVSEKAIRSSR